MVVAMARIYTPEGVLVSEQALNQMDEYLTNVVPPDFSGTFNLCISEDGQFLNIRPVQTDPVMSLDGPPICPICTGTVGSCPDHDKDVWKAAALGLPVQG